MKDLLFLDVENVPDGDLLVVGFALNEDPVTVLTDQDIMGNEALYETQVLWDALKDPDIGKVEATKHDARELTRAGFTFAGPIVDTTVMAYVLNENTPLDLDWLTWRYAGVEMDKRLKRSAGVVYFTTDDDRRIPLADFVGMDRTGPEWQQLMAYNVRDVDALRELYKALRQRLDEGEWTPYWEEEQVPYTGVLFRMEMRGLPINLDDVAALTEELEPEAERQRVQLLAEAGLPDSFNLNSQKQLGAYLFSRVLAFPDALKYDKETIECLKSCLAGEHEDCEWVEGRLPYPADIPANYQRHIVDLLPEGFVLDSVGREQVHGHWSVKGRALPVTPHTVNKLTGKESRYPSVSSPDLLYYCGRDDWVRELCTGWRKTNKLLTTYLRTFPKAARNERGETYDEALQRVRGVVRTDEGHAAGEVAVAEESALRSPVRGPVEGDEQRGVPDPASGREAGVRAPLRDAGTAGDARPSRERGQDGQPAGEPDGADARGASLGTFRLYGTYKQTGTVTGRLSSAGPNLQNQPARGTLGKRVRKLYQGNFVIGDFDQLEMRILAHFSGDPRLTQVFHDGEDPHVLTMRAIFGDVDPKEIAPGAALSYRDAAKQLNYAMGYGAGPKKIAQTLSLFGFPTTPDTAKGYQTELMKFYRVMFKWKDTTIALAKRRGSVRTLGGHRRRLKGAFRDTANWKAVGYGERQAVNAIIQGTAADILRRAMVRADAAFEDLKMLAQVHDEVIWEHPGMWLFDADPHLLPELQECMETGHGFDLRVPLVFEPVVVDSWADKSGASLVELFEDEEEEFDDAE